MIRGKVKIGVVWMKVKRGEWKIILLCAILTEGYTRRLIYLSVSNRTSIIFQLAKFQTHSESEILTVNCELRTADSP